MVHPDYTFTREVKEKWLAALKSGDYYPATARLVHYSMGGVIKGHCCLGVLAAVMKLLNGRGLIKPIGNSRWEGSGTVLATLIEGKIQYLYLPPDIQDDLAEQNDRTGEWPIEAIEALPTVD